MMTNAKLVFLILLIQSYATNSASAVLRDHDVELEPPVTVTASSVADATTETIHHEVAQQRSLTKWRHEAFPSPERDANACGSSRICDPDSILQEAEVNALEVRIEQLETSQTVACTHAKVPIEVAVALVQMMDLVPFGSFRDEEAQAAESFATYLHDDWGVGKGTACGGTGVLFFLSIRDRAMFISCGKAVKSVLTDRRLDHILDKVKPFLRSGDYSGGILKVLEQVEHYLTAGEPTAGERREEMLDFFIPLAMFGAIVSLFLYQTHRERKEQRVYAQVQSQLSELDRSRAEALQGQYECTSCPICLDEFPAELTAGGPPKNGSDGQPLKLLRCGHVFDETCWTNWVNSGQGNVRRCPICQQDVGYSTHNDNDDTNVMVQQQNNVIQQQHDMLQQENNMIQQQNNMQDNRVFRQYNRERNFRLARMGARFPRYIRPEQIQRWTESTFDGTLARDPTFVQNDPRIVRASSQSKTGNGWAGTTSSFGGGSSAGGRGGRW